MPAPKTVSPSAPSSAHALISAHGGRVTRTRVAVVKALQASRQPLSQDEIGARLSAAGLSPDRATLYRTLDWLVGQGLAERIASGERAWRFELKHADEHRHAHFHCDRCGQIVCLDNLLTEVQPELPSGFALARSEWVLHGACSDCNPTGDKP